MRAKILIVENDDFIRSLICKVLRQEGYEIVAASDGAHALDLLHAQWFDLVITDFVMPKLNGLELVEWLHTLQGAIPIIFITGHLAGISFRAILDDVEEVLPKPFDFDRLPTSRRVLKSTSH